MAPQDPAPRKLQLDDVDLLPEQTSDDVDAPADRAAAKDPAAVLRRYLDETPPHHGD
ncbi:MAG: hypothetical protein LCI03_18255 [Actinobacteria bacterium]|nr:hypothetical protein [Actinomycetota bacterium]